MNVENEKKVSFDDYVETYQKEIQSSIGFIGQDHNFFIEVKADIIKRIAYKVFAWHDEIKILDIGCGIGLIDHHLISTSKGRFKNLYGVDVEEGVIEKAKEYNPAVNYKMYDGRNLPFEEDSMDMVFAVNVMHHVPPADWHGFSKEMHRVTKKGGIAIVFEHNPLNPLTRLAVSKCEFDRDAVLLHRNKLRKLFLWAGFEDIDSSFILFFPFRNTIFRTVESVMSWIPFGAQFYITGKKT